MASLSLTSGNDTRKASEKSAIVTIDGLGGIDTLSFNSGDAPSISKFSLAMTGNSVLVSGTTGATSWFYTLKNFEIVKFKDGTVYLGSTNADSFEGKSGNTYYLINNTNDTISEASGGGTDGVFVAISEANASFKLPTNVEVATITSTVALNVIGNNSNNKLTGNFYANSLSGLSGADNLIGGGGNDTLNGGSGADKVTGGTGSDTFKFSAGDSGQSSSSDDAIADYAKGIVGVGDKIDFSSSLVIGGSSAGATDEQAKIDNKTAVATFAAGSGTSLSDALSDISSRFDASTDLAGEFAFFKVNNQGNYFMFISDGMSGVSAKDVVVELVGVKTINGVSLIGGDLTITS